MVTSVFIDLFISSSHDRRPFEVFACHLRDANRTDAYGEQFTETSLPR